MSDDSNLLMIGLRGSGKTSYLAALWHYLESGEANDRLSVPSLQPNREYLNAARDNWLSLYPAVRTSLRSEQNVVLPLYDAQTQAKTTISLPDLSGESFRLQWATRKAANSYVRYAKNCRGVFLFIHPQGITRTHPIKPPIASEIQEDDNFSETITPGEQWTPDKSSTQVQLVDVLQILLYLREVRPKLRLALIVSAWDLVKANIAPAVWLDIRMPLLSQYIRSNYEKISSEAFGVSAQGGDLTADRRILESAATPSSRCFSVIGNRTTRATIAAPLQFLLDNNESVI